MPKPATPKWSTSEDSLESAAESTAQLLHPEESYLCGVFSHRPTWLQRFAHPRWYFINYALMGILSGAYKSYMVGTLSTIERRFQLSNSTSAFILIADNISSIVINVVAGYYANWISRPKLMSIGSFIVVLGCVVNVLPFVLYGPGITNRELAVGSEEQKLCHARSSYIAQSIYCKNDKALSSWVPFLLFFFGNFLNGCGGSVYFVVGTTYMDDNIRKKNSPFYFGSSIALRLLGPVLGFLTSSFCLIYNEDILNGPPVGLTPKNPLWIGAWWQGYIFFGLALGITAIPMMFFPRILPVGRDERANKITEKKKGNAAAKDILAAILRLVRNPIFALKSIGFVFSIIATVGYATIFTKYLEHQFGKSASSASFLSATSKVLTNMIGVLAGGLVIQFLKPSPVKVAGYVAIAETIFMLAFVLLSFIGCPSQKIHGLTDHASPYLRSPIKFQGAMEALVGECNSDCGCSINDFSPVCSRGRTLFSPCYAGCQGLSLTATGTVLKYENCTCIESLHPTPDSALQPGFCGRNCNTLFAFLLTVVVSQIIGSSGRTGSFLIYLRSVDPKDKSMALGAGSSFINLFAFIPYPLIYGYLLDNSCILWDQKCDGSRGSCQLYDVDKMRITVHTTTAGILLIGLMCHILVIFYTPRIKNFYNEPDERREDASEERSSNGIYKAGDTKL